ncbi:MAG: CO dehydrogenase/acetyl-CoA synthase complex subunit epsilon [Candidatus Bathyarchaeia archaeon]
MNRAEPWQRAEIPGPRKAFIITRPDVVAAMVRRAKRPILIIGHEALNEGLGPKRPIDYAFILARTAKAPLVAIAETGKELARTRYEMGTSMSIMDIANRLRDPEWKGLDGSGQYDLVLLIGVPYYLQWVILSGLKHFAPRLRTVSLDRFYQPHASWSFPNLPVKEWLGQLEAVAGQL